LVALWEVLSAGTPDCGLGAVAGACSTDWIVVAARCVHTTGFALPVVNAAVSTSRHAAPAATSIGSIRHGRRPATGPSA
jgi:hypothetical protein